MIGIICAWFNIVICVGVPTAVFAFLLKKSKQSLKIFSRRVYLLDLAGMH